MRKPLSWIIGLLIVLVVTALLLAVARGLIGYSATRFRGDGRIADSDFWSYPRYSISFDEIPLTEDVSMAWNCSGLPAERMTFSIRVAKVDEVKFIRHDAIRIAVRLTTRDGTVIGDVDAPLEEWTIGQSATEARLWHQALWDMQTWSNEDYVLTVKVTAGATDLQKVRGVPCLQGEGNELP